MGMSKPPFSLLMSVYIKDNVDAFCRALESIQESTVKPSEVVLVLDGPVNEGHEKVINQFSENLNIQVVRLPKNLGLGPALNEGMKVCKEEWIARFDSDDICLPERFEKQTEYISLHPEVDIVGGWISEFSLDESALSGNRVVPEKHEQIVSFAKFRNPFNHMTVMYKKAVVVSAGGYQNDFLYEDYALWVRMFLNGARSANLQQVLVLARTGNGMILRRGGWRYMRSEMLAQRKFAEIGFITKLQLLRNLFIRVPVRLAGQTVRSLFYRSMLRSK